MVEFGKAVPFVIVPKNDSLPIMRCSMHDCISSWGDVYSYGHECWKHQGHDSNPFYHYNESIKWAEGIIARKTGEEDFSIGWNAYKDYDKVLKEFSQEWRGIAEVIMADRDEQITLKFKTFKIVSNVDMSIFRW